jgi:hypothetical protein
MPCEDHSRYPLKLPQLRAHLDVELPGLSSIRYVRSWKIGSWDAGNLLGFWIGSATFLSVKDIGTRPGPGGGKDMSMELYHRDLDENA